MAQRIPLGDIGSGGHSHNIVASPLNSNGKRTIRPTLVSGFDGYCQYSPSVVRRKIRTFVDNSDMSAKKFQDIIGVSYTSYTNFMGQTGNKGEGTDCYPAACQFFEDREARGEKMPRKQAKKKADDTAGSKNGKKDASHFDVSDIHLAGEDTETVPIFDTCDEIRRKINLHLKEQSITKAMFRRQLEAQFPGEDPAVRYDVLEKFRSKKGPIEGAASKAFYGAYVYFEKLRLKQGKNKTKHRLDMEQEHGSSGLDRPRRDGGGIWCFGNQRPYINKLGTITRH